MVPFDLSLLRERHNITFEAAEDNQETAAFALDTEEQIELLLNRFGEGLNTSDKRVIGSLFVKRYSTLIAGALYLWTHRLIGLEMSLKRVRISMKGIGLSFHIPDQAQFEPLYAASEMQRKNDLYIGHLLSDNVSPLFSITAQTTGIRETNLWSHFSYLLAYWRKEWIREAETCELGSRVENVYRVMTEQFNPYWFPGQTVNPIVSRFRNVADPLHEGQSIMLRDKCCLNYRLPGEDRYCYTCPLITDEKRLDKYMAVHAKEHIPVLGKL
ncbi:(2Fe-2S)-binding protein [Paenibacillus sp. sptzw28]|uniref:IucA/IucC family C-terminal-domain containing protein n=1 Tax=Paenibacillus sp. sptzw28 TaxID=715179 RepID=UPI001C6F5458|nr:IucA/IucC family C-terminal-domain containing protein [Paenibacillus sp. sptzw28]QYR19459.1 (2Fe-2S)-binding protein [Paenibacillus sp. sptzw28]